MLNKLALTFYAFTLVTLLVGSILVVPATAIYLTVQTPVIKQGIQKLILP